MDPIPFSPNVCLRRPPRLQGVFALASSGDMLGVIGGGVKQSDFNPAENGKGLVELDEILAQGGQTLLDGDVAWASGARDLRKEMRVRHGEVLHIERDWRGEGVGPRGTMGRLVVCPRWRLVVGVGSCER